MTRRHLAGFALAALATTGSAFAQLPPGAGTPPAPAAAPAASPAPADTSGVEALGWLAGCWTGTVNQRSFREQWSPVRGNMLIGASSTVHQGKVQDFEFLRIEQRPDGVFYIASPGGKGETAFKLGTTTSDQFDTVYTFSNGANEFPQEILYRRASEGWLYATIQGILKGQERKVIFPMRRIDCESGEIIRQ